MDEFTCPEAYNFESIYVSAAIGMIIRLGEQEKDKKIRACFQVYINRLCKGANDVFSEDKGPGPVAKFIPHIIIQANEMALRENTRISIEAQELYLFAKDN